MTTIRLTAFLRSPFRAWILPALALPLALACSGSSQKGEIAAHIEVMTGGGVDEHAERQPAMEALVKIGRPAVSALIKVIKTDDSAYFENGHLAVQVLEKIGPNAQKAIPVLADLLGDEDPLHRLAGESAGRSAARALGAIGKRAVPALIKVMKAENWKARNNAVRALGLIGPDAAEAVSALAKAAKDDDPTLDDDPGLRDSAVRALGKIGPEAPGVVDALSDALKDESVIVAMTAATALAKAGGAARQAVPTLIETLGHEQRGVRHLAAQALGAMGTDAEAAVPMLRKAMSADEPVVRMSAAEALWNINHDAREIVPVLIELLETRDGSLSVPIRAANQVAAIGPAAKRAVPALKGRLNDDYPKVREAARRALQQIAPDDLGEDN